MISFFNNSADLGSHSVYLEALMKHIKSLIVILLLSSLAFPGHRKSHFRKHGRHHRHVINKTPRVTFRIGTHWGWRHNCHGHERVVIVDDTKKVKEESAEEIMAQIEKMAELKEKGLITEKEYEKKKKELLKRI